MTRSSVESAEKMIADGTSHAPEHPTRRVSHDATDRKHRVDIMHSKCIMSSNEPALHQTLPGTGAQAGGPGVPGSRPDRTAPVRQDHTAATCLWTTAPLRLTGSAGRARRGGGRSARVPGTVSTTGHLRRGATCSPPASLHQSKGRRAPKSEGSVLANGLAESPARGEGDRVAGGPRRHAAPVAVVKAGSRGAAKHFPCLGTQGRCAFQGFPWIR